MSKDLCLNVRQMDNIFRAWCTVRANVLASSDRVLKSKVRRLSSNPVPGLRKIIEALQQDKYKFSPQRAYLQPRKNRPIVVAKLEDRIVQRAVLQVLQTENHPLLGNLGEIIRTPTSVGGVPRSGKETGGIQYGLELVKKEIAEGAFHFFRSDIKKFFTKIPKSMVFKIVENETKDKKFVNLLKAALSTELQNPEEVKEFLYLFPLEDVGVPQGSSLSVFAGNIILKEFDDQMNGRGLMTIRYIDDFVILGHSHRAVSKGFESGQEILKSLGMSAYMPDEDSTKAKIGEVSNGFDFLGCAVREDGVHPSRAGKKKFLKSIDDSLNDGQKQIRQIVASGSARQAEAAYVQVLSKLDNKIRGWADAFSFTNSRRSFSQLDKEIDKRLSEFIGWANREIRDLPDDKRRRALGVSLLGDSLIRKKKEGKLLKNKENLE